MNGKAYLLILGVTAATFVLPSCQVSEWEETRPAREREYTVEAVERIEPAPSLSLDVEEELPKADEAAHALRDLTPFVVKATASSLENPRLVAEHAFDGNRFTRWASARRDGEYLEGYFDRPVVVAIITVRWERARSAVYSILGKLPDEKWELLARWSGSPTGLVDVFELTSAPTITAIRVFCERRATEWGNSIFELQMTGWADGNPPTNNLIGYFPPSDDLQKARERAVARRLLAVAQRDPSSSSCLTDDEFLDLLQRRTFAYFWYETNPTNGLTRDRAANFDSSEDYHVASVAAVGFALSAYVIGVERGWISRSEGRERTRITLRTFAGNQLRRVHGFYPHFVDMYSGKMIPDTEISTIDTALFLAGMITAMEYFRDAEIRSLATKIFENVNWRASAAGDPHFVTHGWDYVGNMLGARWGSFTEGILLYILAIGSPTYPLPPTAWDAIDRRIDEYSGYPFVVEYGFQSMFRYQYPALWYDFRGKKDQHGIDFFENATLAMLAMRQYCIDMAVHFPNSYGHDRWGLSAADGPGDMYMIFGFPPGNPYSPTDGTIVPYAIAGSLPFAPCHVIRALRKLYDDFKPTAWGKYGIADSLNPTIDFVARDMIGIDAGTILLAIENYRSGLIWQLFSKNSWIQRFDHLVSWKTRPTAEQLEGPIDLARSCEWRLRKGPALLPLPPPEDPLWVSVAVPDFWENLGGEWADYDGEAWYEIEFELSKARRLQWQRLGTTIELRIGAIDDGDEVFINGAKIGETIPDLISARLARRYRVPPDILRAGKNILSIRVVDQGGKGGIWLPPIELGPAYTAN